MPHWRRSPHALRGLASRYRIERELGRGGMAIVYLARDRQLDRFVAIKVLHSSLSSDATSVARMTHEARAVARVQHPNIVAIHDLETLRDGGVALVMQFVDGKPLRTVIEEAGPLPFSTVDRVLGQIASALGAAHRSGVIHRDVKPENIYIERESGRSLLADFGIAQAPRVSAGMTLAGEALGTPHYMSPEQIAGSELDGRSDLYSLGLVGYEMLTGERPWQGESLYRILHRQQYDDLPSLSRRRPDSPPALVEAITRCMSKDRMARPTSSEDFLKILRGPGAVLDDNDAPVADAAPIVSDSLYQESSPAAETVRFHRSAEFNYRMLEPPPFTERDDDADQPRGTLEGEVSALPTAAPSAPHSAVAREVHRQTGSESEHSEGEVAQSPEGADRDRRVPRKYVLATAVGVGLISLSAVWLGFGSFSPAQGVEMTTEESSAESPDRGTDWADNPGGGRAGSSAPAPARGGGGQSRPAAERYVGAEDLSDVFCQPREAETVEDWLNRVPAYCIDRLR